MKVMMSDPALDDVEALEIYVSEQSPSRAKKLTKEIFARARSLATMPRRGRVIPELGDPNLRELIVGDCRLTCVIVDYKAIVEILALLHASRAFPLDRFLDD